jgi:sulfatase modifying factor 1
MMIKFNLIPVLLLLFFQISCNSTSEKKTTMDDKSNKAVSASQDIEIREEGVNTTKSTSHMKADTAEMVYFSGGEIMIGSDKRTPQEAPAHKETVSSFYIDRHPVTVKQFRAFVDATGYKTDAEKFGDSGVFDFKTSRWQLMKGAYWKYPLGPDDDPAKDDHPVTHVSWNDAYEYAKWAGKRLPKESEWEYAAKSGQSTNNKYPWGNSLKVDGKYKANVWQGDLNAKQGADGFKFTSPVGSYEPNDAGMTDVCGNVWEWCSDAFKSYGSNAPGDPKIRVIRGGSFFYDEYKDLSYTMTFRNQNTIETSLFNTGFRCALSVN